MAFPKSKASSAARGYGSEHQKLRAKLLPAAYGQPCTRCGRPLRPGQDLHLDHTDDRTGYAGFAHASCNRKAGARKGARVVNRIRRGAAPIKAKLKTTRAW